MSDDPNAKRLASYAHRVEAIKSYEPILARLSDEELRRKTVELRAVLASASAEAGSGPRRKSTGAVLPFRPRWQASDGDR